MFIKHGDGKIVSVMPEKELTEEQKKTAEELSQQLVAQSSDQSDTSKEKKSGS